MRIALVCRTLIVVTALLAGCGGKSSSVKNAAAEKEPVQVSPQDCLVLNTCKLDVVLQPELHRIEATAELTIASRTGQRPKDASRVRLQLNPALGIDAITHDGQPVVFRRCLAPTDKPDEMPDADAPKHYEVDWYPPEGLGGTLVVRYGGQLVQNVNAGEVPGQVHNFEMRAHIGEEGIYLAEDGDWYPTVSESAARSRREKPLTQFDLTATEVPGMVLVASGNRKDAVLNRSRGERTTWHSPFPMQGLALAGGKHTVHQRQVGDVLVSAHLLESHAYFAPAILDATESYLKLYQPLIGEYPYREFTVVENFFSSGFAFPGFTLLASGVIERGGLLMRPGLLDHELIHNWWGNGVFVSTTSGNWCEALTSYCANYMRHVLEGRSDEARAKRRNTCHRLSRLAPEEEKPLSEFGLPDGPSRLIGYDKGAMVFAMLADEIGQETMWRSLKRLYSERRGKPTTWADILAVLERQSGKPLDGFFKDWVYGTALPELTFQEAQYDAQAQRISLTILQKKDRFFDIELPIRLVYESGSHEEIVYVNRGVQVPVIPARRAPKYIEIDPDYRILRKVSPSLAIPTLAAVNPPLSLVVVRPENDAAPYEPFIERMVMRYQGPDAFRVKEVTPATIAPDDLASGHVLVIGDACRMPAMRAILENSPLTFGNASFAVEGVAYCEPGNEVLCCMRNERTPGAVICFYCGNKPADLKKARVLTFYGSNSIVVFKDGKVVLRKDLEQTERIEVETVTMDSLAR